VLSTDGGSHLQSKETTKQIVREERARGRQALPLVLKHVPKLREEEVGKASNFQGRGAMRMQTWRTSAVSVCCCDEVDTMGTETLVACQRIQHNLPWGVAAMVSQGWSRKSNATSLRSVS
jgi:hypothetical protein